MNYIVDKKQVGAYLKKLVKESQYSSNRQFGKEYLKMMGYTQPDDIEINRMNNRLSQIFNGKKGIQMEDMLIFSDLLGVSCEEILSAGERRVPVSSHMTNYRIAFSQDEELWSSYMKREDKLFLNSDEYGKTVIDYAIEFKNYPFIKWLLDEEFIWLVDNSGYRQFGYSYGGGTSIEKRAPWDMDNAVPLQVKYDDQLRTQILTLALENKDYGILDKFLARETPFLHRVTFYNDRDNAYQYYSEDYVRMIAGAPLDILDYFSQEFEVENCQKWKNTYIYPFCGELLGMLTCLHEEKKAKFLAKRVLEHNEKTYKKVVSMLDAAYEIEWKEKQKWCGTWEEDNKIYKDIQKSIKVGTLNYFNFSKDNHIVSFFYSSKKEMEYFLTNMIKVDLQKVLSSLKETFLEINMWYDRVAALKETWGCE